MDLDTSKDDLSPNTVGCEYPELASWGTFPDEISDGSAVWVNGLYLADPDWTSFSIGGGLLSSAVWPAAEIDSEVCEQQQLFSPAPEEDAAVSPTCSWSPPSSPVDAFDTITAPKPKPRSQTNFRPMQATRNPSSLVTKSKRTTSLRTAARKPRKSPGKTSPRTTALSPQTSRGGYEESTDSDKLQARKNHNVVEKQYRNRLNAQFERLLSVLLPAGQQAMPAPKDGEQPEFTAGKRRYSDDSDMGLAGEDRRLSKAEVLDVATNRIKELEADRARLLHEKKELVQSMELMNGALAGVTVRGRPRAGL
ncbi:hypothetical protein B0T16DRAFT_411860 [Cercophora newfieldiana]|uniref:BHLH domain-containing protein n=1 Tax=Cercophora newfieldiana TaxID=92897 RepID=A0AA39Y482_9PEZI|nr:hypothetical protein B0T16DRAFT_411860 [Cercophora newfieldiana]